MLITPENYRSFLAIANSDLGWLKNLDKPPIEAEEAYKFGTGLDAFITEFYKVDLYRHTIDGVQYTAEDFNHFKIMKREFLKNRICQDIIKDCSYQHISYNPKFQIEHDGFKFTVPAKCKWDLKKKHFKLGGDIKSTVATTLQQCLDATKFFDYDRSRAWYMDLEGHNADYLIYISKKNYKVFVIPADRNHWVYKDGLVKYQSLAFQYWKNFIQ